MEPGGGAPPLRGPPRGRASDADGGMLVPRGPVSEDVMAGISERATAIFSSCKHKVSGMLEPQQGPYALALVGAMLGLNQKQLDAELQMTARVGRRTLSYEDFMSACEAMVALHGALAQQQIRRLPNNDMSGALRSAFNLYVKLNVGGFVGGDQRMNSNQFTKMCQDAGIMEPNGPASMSTLQISWASCKATFGSTRLQYNQFLKVIGALAAELSGDVFLLVAGLGLQLPTVPPLRNGFRKPDAGEVNLNLPKPEMVQGVGAHVAAEEAYEKYMQEGKMPDGKRGDPLARGGASPMKARASMNGGVPNWVKAMQADQGSANPMTSGQDIRGIPVIETPDSDDEAPRKPQARKPNPVPPDEPVMARGKASPMRPRVGKLPAMGSSDPPASPGSRSVDSELLIRADAPNYGGPGNRVDVLSAPVSVRPRDAVRNGIHPDSDAGPLEPSLMPAPPRARKAAAMAPEGFREVVEQQQAAVKALEGRVEEQKQREQELFERVQLLTEKLADAQVAAAVTLQSGCPGAQLPDVPQGKGRTVVSGRCPLTDQVERLTEQMAEVLARLSALESIRMQPKAPSEPPPKTRNPVGTRTPEFPDEPTPVVPVAVAASWGPPGGRGRGGAPEPEGVRVISPLEPVNSTQGEWMSRLLLNLDKRVRMLEGAAGKGDADADGEALAEVLKQLRGMQTAGSPAPPAPPAPGAAASAPPDPAFLKVDPKRKMEKVGDSVDMAPALLPTGDPELDRRLAALANEMRSKHATVGLLLDMLNQTRGEVAALAAQLNARGDGDGSGGPVVVGQRASATGGPGHRNAIRVVDGGLVAPDMAPGLSPPMRRGEPAPEGMAPLEPHLENLAAEQHGLKRAVRELCAAIGVAPPPVVAAIAAAEPAAAVAVAPRAPEAPEPWGQPGRKTLKEETQEVKRSVEGVQADMGELKRQVEQIRAVAGFGEWPQPLRQEPGAATTVVVPGVAPVQAVMQGQGRNPVQVTVGAPSLQADPMGLAPGRRPMQPGGELAIAGLPDAEVHSLKDELRRVKAFVGMQEAAPAGAAAPAAAAVVAVAPAGAAAAAAEQGKWADAGRGPQPLKDAVATVAGDVDALRKHVKAMDAALRTNIGNTNNLTSFLNEHAPALAQAVQPSKDAPAAGGRNPITVTAGELQQQGGLQPPGKKGPLSIQNEGAFEAGGLDPVEYQRLKDQVRSMARFLGGPIEPSAGSPSPAAPPPPGATVSGAAEAERVGMLPPWGAPGRGGHGGATVAEGLGQVSNDVEALKKQMAQMGFALRAAGVVDPAVEAAAAAAVAAGGAEAATVAVKQRNPISVMPGGAGVDGSNGFAAPGRKSQPGQEGAMPGALEADVGRLKDDVRAMKHFLGMSLPPDGAPAAAAATVRGAGGEGGQAGHGSSEPWGRAGQFSRDVNNVDPIRPAGGYGNVGEMVRDLDAVKRRQVELEEAMRAANIPLAAAAEQSGLSVRVVAGGAAQRNPITVSSGLVERQDAVGLNAPKRPLQPLTTIEGVPEPVLDHLGAMQDDLRRVTAFLGMRSVAADPAAPHTDQPAASAAAARAAPAPGQQQPWGTPPGPREAAGGDEKVDKLSDLVRDVQETKQRQAGTERVLMAMGAQIPWAMEGQVPAGPGAQPVAVGAAAPQEQAGQQRQRNPISVTAGGLQEGATGFAPTGRKQLGPAEGMPEALPPVIAQLADDVKRVQAFLGMGSTGVVAAAAAGPEAAKQVAVAQADARSAGVEPWGQPGREPRQPGQEVKNLGEVVRDVDQNNRRTAQLEEALRAAGIPIPPPQPAGTVAVSGPAEQAGQQRQRNPIQVTAGGLQEGTAGFTAPGRKLLALEGLPEPAQLELARMADDVKRMQAFLGMNPAGVVPVAAAAAGPEAAKQVAVAPADARSAGVEPWGQPGREPRQPGQDVKNLGEVVRETDQNNRRIASLEEALRAAGIPIPPPQPAGAAAVSGPAEQAGQQRQRNPISVTAGALDGTAGFAAPGRKLLPSLEGLPEPAQLELSRMADELKRVQAFMGMGPAGVVAAAAAGPEAAKQVAVAPGEARNTGVEPWGSPGREPRQPGQEVKNLGDMLREMDQNNRRIAVLEEALRAAGIPIPPTQSAGVATVAASGPAEQAGQQRQRNPISVTAGALDGTAGFAAPGRKPLALEGLPEPTQVELARMADDVKRMQAFLGMNPAGVVPVAAAAAGPEAAKQVAVAPADARSAGVEPWGQPGREPRQPGQEVKNLGEVVRDVDQNNRRMAQLEEALRAAGIPIPPPQPAGTVAVSGPAEQAGQQRQRNPIQVTAGGLQEGTAGFTAPGRKLLALEGLPEPTQVELARMADDVKRMQAFLGMNTAGVVPVAAAAAGPEAAKQVAVAPADARSAGVEPWGQPGREPRQPGQEVKNLGEVVRDVDQNNRRMAQLEEALRAAGIPIPPPQPAGAVAVSGPAEQAGQQRQRNPISVTAGALDGTAGFAAPGRKLLALEGLPEPTQVELARMADDLKRVQAFLGMNPSGIVPAAAAAPEAAKQVAVAPADARSAGVEPWGQPGREPRQPGQEVKNLGEVVRDVDQNNRRTAQLEEALRAAGIPIPPPQPAGAVAVSGPAEQAGQQRQRNPISVTAGALDGTAGFAAPGRKLNPIEGLPEPAQAELVRLADELKRVQAFLGMGPAGGVAAAAAGPEAAKQVAVAPADARSAGVEPWGQPGREPRQPGQEVKNLGEVVKDVDGYKQRTAALEEALRAAGIPLPAPGASAAVEPQQPQQQGQQRQRNPVAVSSGLVAPGETGFVPPQRRGPGGAAEEALSPELMRMADDLKRVQAFLGMNPAGPVAAAGPEAAKQVAVAPADARSAGVEPWGQPGREPRQPGQEVKNLGDLVKDVDGYKQRVAQLEEALRAAGIPLPAPGTSAAVEPQQPQQQGQQRQRNPIAVSSGLVPTDGASGFTAPKRAPGAEAPPESLPARVDALQDDVKRVKAFLGMQDGPAGPAAAAAGPDGVKAGGTAAATDKGPWAGPGRDKAGGGGEGVAKELEDVKQQLNDLDRALRGAGMGYMLPKEGAGGPTAVQRQPELADKQRGAVAVTTGGLQRPLDTSGYPPLARKDGLPPIETPSFVDANDYGKLKDDVDRLKAFMGMETAKDPKEAAAPAGAAAGVAAAAGAEPWANKSLKEKADEAEKAVKDMAGEVDGLRKKVVDMEEALRTLGVPDRPQQAGATPADVKGGDPAAAAGRNRNPIAVSPGLAEEGAKGFAPPDRKQVVAVPEGIAEPVVVDGEDYRQLKKAMEDLQSVVGQQGPPAPDGKKGKTLKEDTDDIKKFVRAMGKDVGAMGNDMQTLKKHLDDVEGAMNRALANLAAEMAKMKLVREEEPDSPEPTKQGHRKLEGAGDNMADTINAMAALNAAQQQQLARAGDDGRAEDIDALNEAMRQSENQLARLLAFLKQDVMDRFAVHEKTLIRMAKQIDFIQRMLKGDFDEQRDSARDAGSSLTVSAPDGSVVTTTADA